MQPGLAAGEMPAVALPAAVAAQALTELRAVPERRSAGFGLGRKPALARADLAPTRLAGLLVGEPALDVPLTHDRAHAVRTASLTGLPSASRRPSSERHACSGPFLLRVAYATNAFLDMNQGEERSGRRESNPP